MEGFLFDIDRLDQIVIKWETDRIWCPIGSVCSVVDYLMSADGRSGN